MHPGTGKIQSILRARPLATRVLVAASIAAATCAAPSIAATPAASEPVIQPPATLALLDAIGRAPSAARIEADVRKLVGFGTRHTLSDQVSSTRGIGAATRWIKAEFERISAQCGGCIEVIEVADTVTSQRIPTPTVVTSILAIQRGSSDPGRVVMMSGDIDSRVTDIMDSTSDSPGANDNASGMAGAIEAARVLSRHRFPATIVYAALSGEEQGLDGGRIVAAYARAQGWRVEAVLNNDMIGNIRGITGVTDNSTARVFSEGTRVVETADEAKQRRFTGGEVDSASRNLARYIDAMADAHVPNLDVMLVYRLDRFGRGGHHRPFNEVGYPAVRVMETNEDYTRQHQDLRVQEGVHYGDTLDGVDFSYAARLTALDAVSLAGMASAPPPPADVTISGAVSADTTLKWTRAPAALAPNLAGYRIHWRLTDAPQWTHGVYVGDVASHTLANTIIDNFYFGVSAVGTDGSESPVVFPGAAGSFGAYSPSPALPAPNP